MHTKINGYTAGALLLLPTVRKLRELVEFEKFQCRVLKDNETTQTFKQKTTGLNNQLYAFRYNNKESNKLTAAGKNEQ
jgi:hypothetical protein